MFEKRLIFRGGCRLVNMGSSDITKVPGFKFSDQATTLIARDYKGFGNQVGNGVIEIYEINSCNRNDIV